VLDRALQIVDALGGVVLNAGFERRQATQARFDLAEGLRMPLPGRGPLLEDLRAPVGELGEAALRGLELIFLLPPEVKGEVQLVDLRLELGETLLEPDPLLLIHLGCLVQA